MRMSLGVKHSRLMGLQANQKEIKRLKAKLQSVEGNADAELTFLRGQETEAAAALQVSCSPLQAKQAS